MRQRRSSQTAAHSHRRDAPPAVTLAIAAANQIHTTPYPTPDVHYGPLSQIWPALRLLRRHLVRLYTAGLLTASAETSTELESYGLPGPGRWITLYANSAHVWIVIAGHRPRHSRLRRRTRPRRQRTAWRADPTANLQDSSSYLVRHPPGL